MTTRFTPTNFRKRLCLGASLGAMLVFAAPVATAQDTSDTEADSERTLGAITVTASKRDRLCSQAIFP